MALEGLWAATSLRQPTHLGMPHPPQGRACELSPVIARGTLQRVKDEPIPDYINDAGNNPWEGISQRHGGRDNTRQDLEAKGGSAVGHPGGEALTEAVNRSKR